MRLIGRGALKAFPSLLPEAQGSLQAVEVDAWFVKSKKKWRDLMFGCFCSNDPLEHVAVLDSVPPRWQSTRTTHTMGAQQSRPDRREAATREPAHVSTCPFRLSAWRTRSLRYSARAG